MRNLEFLLPADYTLIDLETTGLSSSDNQIIEIGAIKVRNHGVMEEFSTLVKPAERISAFITSLTGIDNKMVSKAPSIDAALPTLLDFIEEDIVMGHNVTFDLGFLSAAGKSLDIEIDLDYVDTLWMARTLFPESSHSLKDLVEDFGIKRNHAHRALVDVMATKGIYDYMREYIKVFEIDVHELMNKS